MTRVELVRKLLETNHLNVAERRQLVPPAIHFSEIQEIIRDVVERGLCFSSVIGTLEKQESGKYRIERRIGMAGGGEAIITRRDGSYENPVTGKFYSSFAESCHDSQPRSVPEICLSSLDSALQTFIADLLTDPHPLGTTQPFGTIDGIEIQGIPATVMIPLDRKIIPGERIGPVRLTATIEGIVSLLGPGMERGPGVYPGSVLRTWNTIGLWVVSDIATENVLWVSIDQSGSNPWTQYATPEGIHLGSAERDLVSAMGTPERTVTGGGAKSLYYDRRGIRFTVPGRILLFVHGRWPFARNVGAIRIVWPSVSRGDTLIVPGERISNIEVEMPIETALATLGGGYQRLEMQAGVHVYHWPHLGLTVLEQTGRIISVRAGTEKSAESAGVKYATADGLGSGSTATEVRQIQGEPVEKGGSVVGVWWIYRSHGISFAIDDQSQVSHVDVFPPRHGGQSRC